MRQQLLTDSKRVPVAPPPGLEVDRAAAQLAALEQQESVDIQLKDLKDRLGKGGGAA